MAWQGVDEEKINTNYESEFWNPDEGDELTGEVKLVKKGQYGKTFLIIEDREGERWLTTQCASLDKQIRLLGINVGDEVHITYKGRADDEYKSHHYVLLKWVEE